MQRVCRVCLGRICLVRIRQHGELRVRELQHSPQREAAVRVDEERATADAAAIGPQLRGHTELQTELRLPGARQPADLRYLPC